MVDWTLIIAFIPTFFLVSISPGMCMTLAMTLGMTIGYRRTLHMMWGELIGVGTIAISAMVGVAAIMLRYPELFIFIKYAGGAYLIWLGIQLWRSRGKMALDLDQTEGQERNGLQLAWQGFVTAIANPKGWAFFVALLPKFMNAELDLSTQIMSILLVIFVIEFSSMSVYAGSGKIMRVFIEKSGNVRIMNRLSGSLMIAVGIWLATS